jgi:hypothetical protein
MAFIEDAIDVHLDGKRAHAEAIAILLSEPEVRRDFLDCGKSIPRRGKWLVKRLERALSPATFARLSTQTTGPANASGQAETTLGWLELFQQNAECTSAHSFAQWIATDAGLRDLDVTISRLAG